MVIVRLFGPAGETTNQAPETVTGENGLKLTDSWSSTVASSPAVIKVKRCMTKLRKKRHLDFFLF